MQAAIQEIVDPTQLTDAANRETLDVAAPKTVDLQADLARLNGIGLLSRLLEDKSTGKNITWATDQYSDRGYEYAQDQPIRPELILGVMRDVVRARADKSREEQLRRTRTKGEVFTPIWVVGKMTAHILEDAHQSAKNWQHFVDFRMLEITCGEGPFLTTRYDTETGSVIPLHERVGLLDAKLREVTEQTEEEQAWVKWAIRAYESTYGYEYQGDSLLIARINMVMTFIEYFEARWGYVPTYEVLREISRRVVWNIWQMDGLTGRTPYTVHTVTMHRQMSMFDLTEEAIAPTFEYVECRIRDWRGDRSQKWSELG